MVTTAHCALQETLEGVWMLSPRGNDKSSWNRYARPNLIVTQRMHVQKYLMAPRKSVVYKSKKIVQ